MPKYKKEECCHPTLALQKVWKTFFFIFLHNLMFIMKESLNAQHEKKGVQSEF